MQCSRPAPSATAAQPMPTPLAPSLIPAAHSDPDALRAAAAEARQAADAGSPEFEEKQRRVQALLDAMKGEPTEAELMQARLLCRMLIVCFCARAGSCCKSMKST